MSIHYSLSRKLSKPGDSESEKLVYATAQVNQVMDLEQFAQHIADHNTVFDRATISGVLTTAVSCLIEQLLLGNKVELGDLGSFYCSISSNGTTLAQDFTSSDIKAVKVNWSRSKYFKDLLSEATFEYVATRTGQSQARRDEKAMLDEGYDTGSGGTGSGTTGDTGDTGSGSGDGDDDGEKE